MAAAKSSILTIFIVSSYRLITFPTYPLLPDLTSRKYSPDGKVERSTLGVPPDECSFMLITSFPAMSKTCSHIQWSSGHTGLSLQTSRRRDALTARIPTMVS